MQLELDDAADTDYGSYLQVSVGAGRTTATVTACDDAFRDRRIIVEMNGRSVEIPWDPATPIKVS